jgi:arylsulfatase A-like enzyme/Flp pilus assembly protein TadD
LNCSVTPAAAVLLAALASPASPRPNVLLITVDTLRPDALGWVAGSGATPELDRLARAGYRFRAAVSPAPLTLPAHGSILTGLVPRRHGMRDNGQPLAADVVTLAGILGQRGYATGAFVSGFPLARAFGLDRGFGRYDDQLPDGPPDRRERRADGTTAAAAAWIASSSEPWFAWVHYYDPHDPYEPPSAWSRPGPRGAYDGEVAYVDAAIATLRRGVEGRTQGPLLTVFAGDHGESLGEHGESTHGFFLYECTLAVPLAFHFPGRVAPGESGEAARLVDVTPTVLDLLGVPIPSGLDGVSLKPMLSGRAQALPPAYVETLRPWASYGWSPLRAVRDSDWKLIVAPRAELYALKQDPKEQSNRIEAEADRAGRMKDFLLRLESAAAPRAAGVADPETVERLRALGYVGAGSVAAPSEAPAGLPDPKDRIDAWNALGEAEAKMARREYRGALLAFDGVLATEPRNRFALSRSGQALLALGNGDAAVARLEKAVAAGPEHPESRLALAQALSSLGRHEKAVQQWSELTRLQPRQASHWVGLGNALGLAGQPIRAASALERAVELDPRDPELRVRLAFAQVGAGREAEAVRRLEEASALVPGGFAHAGALGVLLVKVGRPGEARRWLLASQKGEGDYAEARFQLALLEAADGKSDAARAALRDALAASPGLRSRAASDPRLAPLMP